MPWGGGAGRLSGRPPGHAICGNKLVPPRAAPVIGRHRRGGGGTLSEAPSRFPRTGRRGGVFLGRPPAALNLHPYPCPAVRLQGVVGRVRAGAGGMIL